MADYDLLIKNGTIVDGLRMPAYRGDIGIRNGKIVAMGTADNGFGTGSLDYALVRLNTNGSLDTTFSGNGKVTVDFGGGIDRGSALALQPSDGKYVVAGYTFDGAQTDFALARVLP